MVKNKDKYLQVIEFRKRGFTYSEIAKICDVSKATVSNWLSKKRFSKVIAKENAQRAARDNKKRMQLLNKTRQTERTSRYQEAIRSAETEFKHYKKDKLFLVGLTTYSAVGDMGSGSKIRLTSNKVKLHKNFINFSQDYLGVDKKDIHFWLLLSGKLPLEKTLKWWSREIGLSIVSFGKTQFVNPGQKPLHKGTGNTIIGNTVLKKKLIRWIELLEKEL